MKSRWQSRFLSVPSFVKGQRVVLRCDAVTHHARIYLNGELLATHECGFLPFEVELTEKLQPGEKLRRLCDEPEPPACTGQQKGNLHPRTQAETGGTLFPGEMASDSGF